jgi:hypothetical protein
VPACLQGSAVRLDPRHHCRGGRARGCGGNGRREGWEGEEEVAGRGLWVGHRGIGGGQSRQACSLGRWICLGRWISRQRRQRRRGRAAVARPAPGCSRAEHSHPGVVLLLLVPRAGLLLLVPCMVPGVAALLCGPTHLSNPYPPKPSTRWIHRYSSCSMDPSLSCTFASRSNSVRIPINHIYRIFARYRRTLPV